MTTAPFPVRTERLRLASGPELHVERSGEGRRALVVLHGGPGLSCDYLSPLHALARQDRVVVMYDQAGGGRSSDPRDLSNATIGYLVDDLAALLDVLELDDVDLLGHSFGVMLALQFALDHPARARSMVLASGGASARRAAGGFVSLLLADQGSEAVSRVLTAEVRGDLGDPGYWAIVGAFLERASLPEPERLDDREAAAKWRAEFDRVGPMGHALWGPWQFTVTGSLRDWDVRSRLGEIDVPVLVTSGRDDYALAHDVIEMTEMLPSGEYVCVGAGHEGFLQGSSLNLFLKLVDGFMQDRDVHASDRGAEVR